MATTYVTKEGDSLWSIAQRCYGDVYQWPRIYEANRDTIGPNPDHIEASWALTIPDLPAPPRSHQSPLPTDRADQATGPVAEEPGTR